MCWGELPVPAPLHTHTWELGTGIAKVLLATGVITLLMMLFYLNNVVIDGLPWSSLGSRELLEVQVVEWLTAANAQRLELSLAAPLSLLGELEAH